MEPFWAVVVGIMFGAGIYLMLRRNLSKLILGLILISNAANMLIMTSAGLTRDAPPMIAAGKETLTGTYADPLPQALVLTAIVIGFGVLAYFLTLLQGAYKSNKSENLDRLGGGAS
ncbi:NADH-quinone oxidoreductase subunit K [Acanthopleuribacter pedis]|uniref:NADH-quinone oxidoreductase subunit K n=1 Tax=Acanthopleuribacter pedis TaxID=442870 RepID=A0A8J7QEG5_9BACT|nr:NADH-quinone oxidoreductase subunit K [Acanthopleuribacter pedis]MBO1322749.1 NADH-quinone oxidoreductase subunit K [Acanthopleuribacter pedis]